MLHMTPEQREEIQKDLDYINWWDRVSSERDFTTAEVKKYVTAENRLKKSTLHLLSSEQAGWKERDFYKDKLKQVAEALNDFHPTAGQKEGYESLLDWLESTTVFKRRE